MSTRKTTCSRSHTRGSHDGPLTRSWQVPGLGQQDQDSHPSTCLRSPHPCSCSTPEPTQWGLIQGQTLKCPSWRYLYKVPCVLACDRETGRPMRLGAEPGVTQMNKDLPEQQAGGRREPQEAGPAPKSTESLPAQGLE